MLSKGMNYKEVAEGIFLSQHTVKTRQEYLRLASGKKPSRSYLHGCFE